MKISTILDHIDSGHMALPKFQRGYVWNRHQVRDLFDSLYHRHPVGGLLVWATESSTADHRGDATLALGIVKLLLDGQQRMTSLYGVVRGKPPTFFDGDAQAFMGLRFHLEEETFAFYQPLKMRDDPLWIDVTDLLGIVKLLLDGQQRMTSLYGVVRGKPPTFFDGDAQAFMGLRFHLEEETFAFYQPLKMRDDPLWIDVTDLAQRGPEGLGYYYARLLEDPELAPSVAKYAGRLSMLLGITEIDLHVEEETDPKKPLDVIVDIFNRLNSGGTKLSKGDLALAKICADWPEARDKMKANLDAWAEADYHFKPDWLLRSVNTVLTGEAKFQFLHDRSAAEIQNALKRARRHIDTCLNLISGRLGLDHDRVLFGRFAIPVMVRYLDQHNGQLDEKDRDKLLFWFVQAGMWGRFSSSTETIIDQDLAAFEVDDGGLDKLLSQLRLWHGVHVAPGHFTGSSLGARFYPVLYMLTRMGQARDWGTGLPLKASLLGKMNRPEKHHIFPKAQLRNHEQKFTRSEINALANFCFLTKDTNLSISDRSPEEYFPEVEGKHPGALASQWIPMDPALWKIDRYRDFLEARKPLLADEANKLLKMLLHGDTQWFEEPAVTTEPSTAAPLGRIASEAEEEELEALNGWIEAKSLPKGAISYDFVDPESGEQKAVFDLAWPDGIQEGLSQQVAVLLNEEAETIAVASRAGFRCFTAPEDFRRYVEREILAEAQA